MNKLKLMLEFYILDYNRAVINRTIPFMVLQKNYKSLFRLKNIPVGYTEYEAIIFSEILYDKVLHAYAFYKMSTSQKHYLDTFGKVIVPVNIDALEPIEVSLKKGEQ
jgi:hypothetical protein